MEEWGSAVKFKLIENFVVLLVFAELRVSHSRPEALVDCTVYQQMTPRRICIFHPVVKLSGCDQFSILLEATIGSAMNEVYREVETHVFNNRFQRSILAGQVYVCGI